MTRRTTVGTVVVLALAAALAAGFRAEARDCPATVGGLGGIYLCTDESGDMMAIPLAATDTLPANSTAYSTAVTTSDPCDPANGSQFTMSVEGAAPTRKSWHPINGVTIAMDSGLGTFTIAYDYDDACGNHHHVQITYCNDGSISWVVDGQITVLRKAVKVD